MSKSNVPERLVRMEDKLDFLINTRLEDRVEQKEICKTHTDWTAAIQKKVDEHEALKNRAVGAAKITALIGTPIFGILGVWLKKKLGGHP